MQLAVPGDVESAIVSQPDPAKISRPDLAAHGWEQYFEQGDGAPCTTTAELLASCPRCPRPGAADADICRTGERRPACLRSLAVVRALPQERGPLSRSRLRALKNRAEEATADELWKEARTIEPDIILVWLGVRASVLLGLLRRGLSLLEVCTSGGATLSTGVGKLGARPSVRRVDWGRDFRYCRQQAIWLALLSLLIVVHAWLSFPCTASGALLRLNESRGGDLEVAEQNGQVFLEHATAIARYQREQGRFAAFERPLPSLALCTQPMKDELAHPEWRRARLDQCRTNKPGPQGGRQVKPTRIRSLDPDMAAALDLRCSGDHTHEVVQGAGTKPSQFYSADMGRRGAKVIIKEDKGGAKRSARLRQSPAR